MTNGIWASLADRGAQAHEFAWERVLQQLFVYCTSPLLSIDYVTFYFLEVIERQTKSTHLSRFLVTSDAASFYLVKYISCDMLAVLVKDKKVPSRAEPYK